MMTTPGLSAQAPSLHTGAGTRTRLYVIGALVYCAVLFLTLVVPLWVPMAPTTMLSAAYLVGFNTRVADIAAVAVACGVLWLAWKGRLGGYGPPPPKTQMGPRFVSVTIVLLLSALSFACWIVTVAQVRYHSDAGYFREQLESFVLNGRHLYTELEFPYGPVLMLLSAWVYWGLHPFGVSITGAYFTSMVLAQAIGMVALAYAMNQLPMRDWQRRVGFVVLAGGACVSLLGMNYTHLRFVPPLALLLLVPKLRSRAAIVALLTAGEMVEFAISPEVGLAFLAACWCYAVWRWREDRWYSVAAVVLPAMGTAVLLLSLKSYLEMLIAFGRGQFNLPMQPITHILIFLFAFTWLVPRYIGYTMREQDRGSRETAVLVALFVYSVGMIPSTLARCDPLHVFFNGISVLVLSLAAVSRVRAHAGAVWLCCVILLVGWMQYVNTRVDQRQIAEAVHAGLMPRLPNGAKHLLLGATRPVAPGVTRMLAAPLSSPPLLDMQRLEAIVGHDTIATPQDIDWTVEQQLRQSGHFRPDFFSFMASVISEQAEQRKVRAMDEAKWMLLPEPPGGIFAETPDVVGLLQGITLPYRVRNPALYLHNSILHQDLVEHWRPVADFGRYRLYQNLSPRSPGPPRG
jgi:hypothetical protein